MSMADLAKTNNGRQSGPESFACQKVVFKSFLNSDANKIEAWF